MIRAIGVIAVLSLAMAGCVTAPAVRPNAAALPGEARCIASATVTHWQVLDDQTLIVQAPPKKGSYLVKLFQPIAGLKSQETLEFKDGDHNGQLCSTGDYIFVGAPMPQRVAIVAVRWLIPPEERALLSGHQR